MRFLEMNPPNLNEVREALACVVRDADRAKDIIGRMRDHIKKAPPRKECFGLNEAINEVIVMVRSAIADNKVSVETRLAEGSLAIHGDRVQLQQVLLNLILNAVEAMGSVEAGARELLVSTEQDHTGVLVAVRDSGPGVDATHLERVFEAFYTTKSGGNGVVDLPLHYRCSWWQAMGRGKRTARRCISVHLAGGPRGLMNCLQSACRAAEPNAGTARDRRRLLAC
jgi:C4-dicarboxylate-specific signal transduction histidine kinase